MSPPQPEPVPYPTVERVPAALRTERLPESTPEPAAEPVSVSSGWGPAAKQPASSETQTSAVSAASEPAARPYPGSDRALNVERRPAHVGVTNTSDELPVSSLGKNMVSERDSEPSIGETSTNTPQMAPSLRRRGNNKKRGFFKRLFGIK